MVMVIFLLGDMSEIQTASAPQALVRRRRDRDRDHELGAAEDGLVARLPRHAVGAHARPRDVRRVHGARADDLAASSRADDPSRLRGRRRRQVREPELVAQRPADVRQVVVVAPAPAAVAAYLLARPPRRVGLELRVSLVVVADAALVERRRQRRRGLGRHARRPREVERDASGAYRDGAVARSRLVAAARYGRRGA